MVVPAAFPVQGESSLIAQQECWSRIAETDRGIGKENGWLWAVGTDQGRLSQELDSWAMEKDDKWRFNRAQRPSRSIPPSLEIKGVLVGSVER